MSVKLAFHAAAASTMVWGYHSLRQSPLDEFIAGQTGGHWQFLTIQGYVCDTLIRLVTLSVLQAGYIGRNHAPQRRLRYPPLRDQ